MFLKYEIIVWKLFMTVENIPYFRRNKIYPDTLYQSRTNWQNCFKQKKTSVQAKNIIIMTSEWRHWKYAFARHVIWDSMGENNI